MEVQTLEIMCFSFLNWSMHGNMKKIAEVVAINNIYLEG